MNPEPEARPADPDAPPEQTLRTTLFPQIGPMIALDDVIELFVTEGAPTALGVLYRTRESFKEQWGAFPLGRLVNVRVDPTGGGEG